MATIDEAFRRDGVYGHDPAPSRGVVIAPAKTDVGAAEQAARDAYARELDDRAQVITDPEISREMRARAGRVQSSLPICEYFGRLREIKQAEDDLQNVSGLEGITLRAGLNESAQALRDAMVYPTLLETIMERHESDPDVNPAYYLTVDASDSDRASVAAACELLGVNAEAEKSRPVPSAEVYARAVAAGEAAKVAAKAAQGKRIDEAFARSVVKRAAGDDLTGRTIKLRIVL